eukprot:1502889-Pyramimonas_sp.AAC.1
MQNLLLTQTHINQPGGTTTAGGDAPASMATVPPPPRQQTTKDYGDGGVVYVNLVAGAEVGAEEYRKALAMADSIKKAAMASLSQPHDDLLPDEDNNNADTNNNEVLVVPRPPNWENRRDRRKTRDAQVARTHTSSEEPPLQREDLHDRGGNVGHADADWGSRGFASNR